MKLSTTLISLLNGISLAATLHPRQASDDLTARVKALEDFLAAPDTSCTSQCYTDAKKCGDDCPLNSDIQEDLENEVSYSTYKGCVRNALLSLVNSRPVSAAVRRRKLSASHR